MKRLMSIFAVVLVLAVPAFALSEEHYLALKTFPGFAAADEKLTRAYNEAEKVMDKSEFDALSESQRAWIAEQRDVSAEPFIQDNYSIADAYTRVTLERSGKSKTVLLMMWSISMILPVNMLTVRVNYICVCL